MGGGVVVADGAQHEAAARAIEEPPDAGDERERQIDEGILPEQDAADEGKVGQDREVEMRRGGDFLADEAAPISPERPDPENGQRQARSPPG